MVDQAYGFEGLDIKGDWLAWARVGAPGNPDELFAENLRTGERISIPRPNLDWKTVWQIVVSGNTVFFATTAGYVWGGDWDVYGFDLVSRGNPFPVKVGPGNFGPISADGDYVLLQEMPNSSYSPPRNLYLRNLASGQDTLLASGSYPIGSVSGNRVVYTDNSGHLAVYDICKGQTSLVAAGPAVGYPPIELQGDTVVWTDQRPPASFGGFFIYGYKFADTTPPTPVCPGDFTVNTEPGKCEATVIWTADVRDDNPGAIIECVPPSGSVFPKGTTRVTCTASDAAGNTAACSFTVTVSDTEPPTISCPPDLTVNTDAGQCSAAGVNLGAPSVADNCGIVTPANDAPAVFPKGTTLVTWTATDSSGNTATCVQRVTVVDREPPTLSCPADIALPCSIDLLVPVTFSASAQDNCTAQPIVTCNLPSGSGFPVGVTTVTCTATDEAGNTSTCTFKVTRASLGFAGFLPPLGGADETGGSFVAPLRTLKLGSTVPVKFTASCDGAPVTAGVHRLQLVKFSDATNSEEPIDASPQDAATTGNEFRLTDGQWHFNLDTKATGMTKGIWQLVATLSDGSQHRAWIQLK
ncbi:MAG TPA: HYR domain-containing protein [Verrucomicrobiae bacterium]